MSYLESLPSHLFTEGRNTSPPGAVGQSQEDDTTATLRQPQGQLPPHDLVVKFPLRVVRSPEHGPVNCPRLSPLLRDAVSTAGLGNILPAKRGSSSK